VAPDRPKATRIQVVEALSEVLDPEIPISVVDMGLIRGVEVVGRVARIKLTYTTLGCPCTEMIQEDIDARLLALDGIERVEIEEVFEPWDRQDISKEGLKTLRNLGVT
jgi:metal-sulfur cluster biosynthetic enzyme